jgi:hypothetical protein
MHNTNPPHHICIPRYYPVVQHRRHALVRRKRKSPKEKDELEAFIDHWHQAEMKEKAKTKAIVMNWDSQAMVK